VITMKCRQVPKTGQDVAEAEFNGQTFSATTRHGATMKLARTLVEAGAADQPWQVIGPDGRIRFHGPSLHRLAKLTIAEPDSGECFKIVPWAPRPDTLFRPPPASPDGADGPAAATPPAEVPEALAA